MIEIPAFGPARIAPRRVLPQLFIPLFVAAVLAAAPAGADTDADTYAEPDAGARAFMDEFGGQAVGILADRSMTNKERDAAVRRLLVDNFDVDAISRYVLGRHWRGASDDERGEFRSLFEDYIVAVYGRRLDSYSGEDFEVERAVGKGDGLVIVSSRIVRPNAPAVRVDWRVRRGGGGWKITDVVIEGVSMVITQRNEFSAVIRAAGGGLDGLMAKMRELVARNGPAANRMAENAL